MSEQVVILAAIVAATLGLSAIGSWLLVRYATVVGVLDVPNSRSAHSTPTPRGGGIAISLASLLGCYCIHATGAAAGGAFMPVIFAGAVITVLGFVDDRRGLSPTTRLLVQGACAMYLAWQYRLAPLPWPTGSLPLGALGVGLVVIAVVWSINLYNFMDGIDGIAAMQGIFVFGAAAVIARFTSVQGGASAAMLAVFAASTAGFLVWNKPPAKLFMGDSGSEFLGFLVAAAALTTSNSSGLSVWTWLILHGVFVADSSTTLVARLIRGENVFRPHRSHVYQRLARRWNSHGRVVGAFTGVNLFWSLPWAIVSAWDSSNAPYCALVAIGTLIWVALVLARVERISDEAH